jgi:hypothetical protein
MGRVSHLILYVTTHNYFRPTLKISGGKMPSAFIGHHWRRPLNLDVRCLIPYRQRHTLQHYQFQAQGKDHIEPLRY